MGKSLLSFEQLRTVAADVEGVLNSRPLMYVDSDPDNNVLTPNHFMYGRNLHEKCMNVNLEKEELSVKSFQHIQLVLKHFWKRLYNEYLVSLQ